MAFIKYNFKENEKRTYKGIDYYKNNDEYIILIPNTIYVKRYTLKSVKECINDYLKKEK